MNLDILWLRDKTLKDADGLPPPDVLAAEIVDQLEAALNELLELMRRCIKEDTINE